VFWIKVLNKTLCFVTRYRQQHWAQKRLSYGRICSPFQRVHTLVFRSELFWWTCSYKVTNRWKIISLRAKRFLIGSEGNEVWVTNATETCSCLSRPYKTELLNLISLCVIFSIAEPSPPFVWFYISFNCLHSVTVTVLAR